MPESILDLQNCLCFIDELPENMDNCCSDFNKKTEKINIDPKLFLNRCSLINEYKYLEAMIVPEGVEEVLYLIYGKSFIKNLYLPSTVKNIKIWTRNSFYKKGKGLTVHVSKENPNFVEQNGNIYTKDFSKLVYCNTENFRKISINSETRTLEEYTFVPVKSWKTISSVNELKRKSLYPLKRKLTLSEGIEKISSGAWPSKKHSYYVVIPSTVKSIGHNAARYFVSKKNMDFSSWGKCLYSKNSETFLKGFLRTVRIKKGTLHVNLENSLFKKIYLPESVKSFLNINEYFRNSYFKVSRRNNSFVSWKGSLYSKDFKTLYYLYVKKNGDVYIHPDCENIGEGAFNIHRTVRIKPGKFYVPQKFQSEEEIEKLKKLIFPSKKSYSIAGAEEKDFSAESVKENIGDSTLKRRSFYPLNKEMIFPETLICINKYFNPGQGEYIPIFCATENHELSKDHDYAEWNGFQIDNLILPVIELLNKNGFETTACCSGHLLKSAYYGIDTENDSRTIASILERNSYDEYANGYIAFDKEYKEIKKLFQPKWKFNLNLKIKKIFHKKKESKMIFYIEPWKKFQTKEKCIIVRFFYKPTETIQSEVMEFLGKKITAAIKNKY